jgi:NAD(P)H-flavin reductase
LVAGWIARDACRDTLDRVETFTAQVSRLDDLTADVRVLTLRLIEPAVMRFEAGQFVSFEIDRPGERFAMTRVYSVASPPSRDTEIELLFNLVPGGPGSTYLFGLRQGDVVHFKGPAGTFVLHEPSNRDLLFVATGTGIAPLRSMIHAVAPVGGRRIRLIWGMRSEDDRYYQEEFDALAKTCPQFSWIVTLSQPSAAWTGRTGYVQEIVREEVLSVDRLEVYVCGGSAMIKDVVALVRGVGVCPIHREQYYKDRPPA